VWFHLSDEEWPTDAITELRQTEQGFGEPEVDRFSVAPTVGRAFLGCPHAKEGKPLFIYEVHVKNPVPATDTADFDTTHEHLITEAVLANEGGSIPVCLLGQVQVEPGGAGLPTDGVPALEPRHDLRGGTTGLVGSGREVAVPPPFSCRSDSEFEYVAKPVVWLNSAPSHTRTTRRTCRCTE
jgi:hypothetical protein